MQGLYKLALVGTKQQLTDFLKKVNDNDPDSVFNEYPVEEGTGLRTTQGYGLQKFLDRYKLVIENTGSGNISGIEEMASEIGQIAPELELMLLTQYLDYSDDYTWTIYYKPAGETEPSETEGILYKGSIGDILSVEEVLNYRSMGATNISLDIDREKLKEYLEKYWYVGHKNMGWYDIHKAKEKLYYGYWSFEAGAIAKILNLDDSNLKDMPYYPYDLVHYKSNSM